MESIPRQPMESMGTSHFAMIVLTNDCRPSSTRKATVFRRHLISLSGDTEICLSFSGCTLVDMLRNQMSTASR